MSILHRVEEDVCEAFYSERVRAMMKGAAWSILPGKLFSAT